MDSLCVISIPDCNNFGIVSSSALCITEAIKQMKKINGKDARVKFACVLVSIAMAGPAISSETYVTEKEWYGVDGYLAHLESQSPSKAEVEFERMTMQGESGSKAPRGSSLHSNKNPVLDRKALVGSVAARSAADCGTTWMDTNGNNLRYDGYLSGISIKIKLTISTLTFSGGSSDPDSCFRRWYYMDYINNRGKVYDREGRRVINANKTRNNEAFYKTEHNYYAVGSVVSKPDYALTTHEAKYKNSSRKFIVNRRIVF